MLDKLAPSYAPEERLSPPPWMEASSSGLRIADVSCTLTAPEGVNLAVVTITTTDDGLVGFGCATFTQRAHAVQLLVRDYLAPLLVGRDPADIGDITGALALDSYWRSGPLLNTAIAGVDMALWDLKGKVAGLPVWQLLGGRVRETASTYVHATGTDVGGLAAQIDRHLEAGYRHVRCQIAVPGSLTYGARGADGLRWDPREYLRFVPDVFAELRDRYGHSVELLHDIHERLAPSDAVEMVRRLDDLGLFFVEDPLAPEDLGWLPRLRATTRSPIAIGELFTSVNEYLPVIASRQIDFIRCHVSAIGGITPAWKLANTAELFGVRTAWHGPRDVSPIGHAANLAMDIASPAFGIQEHHEFSDAAICVFPGTFETRNGTLLPSDAPGLGVEFDEVEARKHPPTSELTNWHYGRVRRPDGTVQRP